MANLLKIKELARVRNISLKQLAEDVGISEQALHQLLGLNINEPLKPLIDSVLAVFLLSVSNKTAPKPMKNAPISGRGRVKIKILM